MSTSLHPVFSFRLHQSIRGPIHFGRYDGIHSCLTAATATDKVLIHSPHKRLGTANNRVSWSEGNYDVALLNFNQEITAIATGRMLGPSLLAAGGSGGGTVVADPPEASKEVLVIGSPTHVLAYQVDDNSDLFYNELAGGAARLLVGVFADHRDQLVIVGGADSVRCFDRTGAERVWLMPDGRVTAMALLDVTGDGRAELIVGTATGHLCVYGGPGNGDRLVWECVESAAAVSELVAVDRGAAIFAYALADGTLGAYAENTRMWRIKSKNRVTALTGYELLAARRSGGGGGSDGPAVAAQLIVGWDTGKVDVRDAETGDVLLRLPPMGHQQACVALGAADYRGTGSADLVLGSASGEVRGYERSRMNLGALQHGHGQAGVGGAGGEAELSALLAQKRALQAELAHYETNIRVNKEQRAGGSGLAEDYGAGLAAGSATIAAAATGPATTEVGIIPANTRLQIAMYTNIEDMQRARIEIRIATNNSTLIRAVLIYADGIFADETYIAYPEREHGVPQVIIPLVLPRDTAHDVHIKALIGHPNSTQYHVFGISRQLPKFAMYAILESHLSGGLMFELPGGGFRVPESWVRFETAERFQRIMLWMNRNFLLVTDFEPDPAEDIDRFRVYMYSLYDRSPLVLDYGEGGVMCVRTDSLELAGELVQSLARFLGIGDLQTEAWFGAVEAQLGDLFRRVEGYQRSFGALSVEMAQKKNQERALVVRIEDSRVHQTESLPAMFGDLRTLTEDLVSSHTIRQKNFTEIQRALEAINAVLKAASKLRVGRPAAEMMTHLKEAVKAKNVGAIAKIICTGVN